MECNQQKMREALNKIRKIAAINICECVGDYSDKAIIEIADAALSEPPRQCDVGTAEEQFKRFLAFCQSESRGCEHCPANMTRLRGTSNCDLAWAQMPYEAEEGGPK